MTKDHLYVTLEIALVMEDRRRTWWVLIFLIPPEFDRVNRGLSEHLVPQLNDIRREFHRPVSPTTNAA